MAVVETLMCEKRVSMKSCTVLTKMKRLRNLQRWDLELQHREFSEEVVVVVLMTILYQDPKDPRIRKNPNRLETWRDINQSHQKGITLFRILFLMIK